MLALATGHDLLHSGEGAGDDEEHVGRVDLQEVLVRVLASTLRWNRSLSAFEDLQKCLLHALTGHVTSDRRVLRLAGDLVDLVDVDDSVLGTLDVEVRSLDELEQDILDVLADVAGFGQRSGVGDGEGDVEPLGQRLSEVGLSEPVGPTSRMFDFAISTSESLAPSVFSSPDCRDRMRL